MQVTETKMIVEAIKDLADAQREIAVALRALGTRDAATPMGAMELLAKEVGEGLDSLTEAVNGLAGAQDPQLLAVQIRAGLDSIADALFASNAEARAHRESEV